MRLAVHTVCYESQIILIFILFFLLKVGLAIATDKPNERWVDLGSQIEACITVPDSCGAVGSAISVWLRVLDCTEGNTIMSSLTYYNSTGVSIFCIGQTIVGDEVQEAMG